MKTKTGFDLDTLIGMDKQAAKQLIFKNDLRFKVVVEDGINYSRGEGHRDDRVNLHVSFGMVTSYDIG